MTTKRFYCGDGDCSWLNPVIAEAFYPHHIDCTDMTDDEFIQFLQDGGDKVTADTNNKAS